MKKIVSFVVAFLLVMGISTTAFAKSAGEYAPYGFTWYDDDAEVWHVQYYEYDEHANAYRISDRVVIKDNQLYDMAGCLIVTDLADFTEKKPTVVFDEDGLYFVSKAGEIRHMYESVDNTYTVSSFVAKYFSVDREDLGEKAVGTSSKKLADLLFSGNYMRHQDPTVTDAYIKTYTVNGDPEKIGYDVYFDSKIVVTTYCKENRVWVETVKRLISDTCKGGKFVGYNGQCSILLYDFEDQTVYEFWYKEGFASAHPIVSDVMVYYFTRNSKGFVNGFVTDKGTYSVSETIKNPTSQDSGNNGTSNDTTTTGKVTDVKNFQSKSMAYNGTTHLGTLSLKAKKLFWKGTELQNSSNSEEFGITVNCVPVWINGDDELYVNSKLIAKNVLRLKYDDHGRVTQYKSSDGVWHNIK